MKKILLSILLYLLLSASVLAQNYYYGWITDTHIGFPGAEIDLENVVHDINNRKEIKFVVVTGDIGEKGRNNELELAKKILDSLDVPYHIIPGNHDTKWSESGCTKFKQLWGNDKFAFQYDSVEHIGMDSGIPWRGGGGHIPIEDLNWLDSVLIHTPKNEQIIFYVHHPLNNDIDNWFTVTNRLRNNNIKAVLVGHGHSNKIMNFNGIPGAMSRSSLHKNQKSWGYTLVKDSSGSLKFFEVNRDSIPKYWGVINNDSLTIPEIDSTQFINYTLNRNGNSAGIKVNLLWKKNLKTTLSASLLSAGDKIYAAEKDGNVFCFDTAGKQLWEYHSGETIFSRPIVKNGLLVLATIEGDLISLDNKTGKPVQIIGLDEPLTSQLVTTHVEYNGQLTTGIIAGTSKGGIYCYDLNTFELIWENHSAKGLIETKPLVWNNRIIYGSWDGYLYCISSKNGTINWKWSENKNFYYAPAACQPVTDGKNVYVTSPDKYVSAVDLLLGTTVWRKKNFNSWESIGISLDKKKLLIKGFTDNFYIVNAQKGKLIKNIKIGFGLDTMPIKPVEWNNNILFGSKNGNIYLINKNYDWKPLLFLGTARVQNIIHVKDNIFAVSNMDGKIILFKLKGSNI